MTFRARRASILLDAGAAILLASGLMLRGDAASPDGEFGPRIVLGTLLCFGGFVGCALAWGAAVGRALLRREDLLICGALGTAFLALLADALAELGLIGWQEKPLLISLLLVGPVIDALTRWLTESTKSLTSSTVVKDNHSAAAIPRSQRALTLSIQLGLVALLAICALQGSLPDGQPDPLFYNLLGPRLWAQAGRFFLPNSMPIVLLATSWDALAIWPQSLLGGDGGAGLLEAQLFSQWLHAIVGGGGCALALAALFENFIARPLLRWTCVLFATSAAAMVWTLPFAKNDWGAAFWLLAGASLLLEKLEANEARDPTREKLESILGGALIGLGLVAKLTGMFTAIPLCALAFLLEKRGLRERLRLAFRVGLAALIAMSPILMRNFATTGNPLFPSMNHLFKSPLLSASWSEYLGGFEGHGIERNLAILSLRAGLFWKQTPLVIGLLILPLTWLFTRKMPRAFPLWMVALASAIWFAIGVGPDASLRLFGAGDLIFCGAIAASILSVAEALPEAFASKTIWLANLLCPALGAVALVFAPVDWKLPYEIFSAPPLREFLRSGQPLIHYPPVGGEAKAWLRTHASSRDTILSLEDNRLYYLSALHVIAPREDAELDRAFRTLPFRQALTSCNADLLITTTDWRGRFRGQLDAQLAPLLAAKPGSILFESMGTKVIDLRRLLE